MKTGSSTTPPDKTSTMYALSVTASGRGSRPDCREEVGAATRAAMVGGHEERAQSPSAVGWQEGGVVVAAQRQLRRRQMTGGTDRGAGSTGGELNTGRRRQGMQQDH